MNLVDLWLAVRSDTAWLSRLHDCGLTALEEEQLIDLEDSLMFAANKTARALSEHRARELVNKFVGESDAGERADARKAYLTKQLSELRMELGRIRMIWGRAAVQDESNDPEAHDFYAWMADCPDLKKDIRKMTDELSRIGRPILPGSITGDDIERAHKYPVWKLAGVAQGSKMKCPWHGAEKNKTLHFYATSAYCFSCCKYFDAIDYLMKHDGLTFVQAVKKLA